MSQDYIIPKVNTISNREFEKQIKYFIKKFEIITISEAYRIDIKRDVHLIHSL